MEVNPGTPSKKAFLLDTSVRASPEVTAVGLVVVWSIVLNVLTQQVAKGSGGSNTPADPFSSRKLHNNDYQKYPG